MPGFRSLTHDTNAITITGNGGNATLTKAAIQTFYQGTSGSAASRRAQTMAWARHEIAVGLGVPDSYVSIGFNGTDITGVVLTDNARQMPI